MNENNFINERKYIFTLKAFALISIVSAHVSVVSNGTNLFNELSGLVLSSIGSMGVGVFLLISGYLFLNNKKRFAKFFKFKIKTIFIPWFFCGTLLFFYVALRKGGLDFYNWITTITVYSHMYYLSILIIFYVMFWNVKHKLGFLLLITLLSIISIKLTGLGVLEVYPYINPFNWAIYFIFGLLIKRYELLENIVLFSRKWLGVFALIYSIILTVYLLNGEYISYWKHFPIISEIVAIFLLFGLSAVFTNHNTKWLVYVGEISFPIYLLHMPFAGIITNLFNRFNLSYVTLLRPFIVLVITIVGIEIVRILSRKIKIIRFVDILLGLNRRG